MTSCPRRQRRFGSAGIGPARGAGPAWQERTAGHLAVRRGPQASARAQAQRAGKSAAVQANPQDLGLRGLADAVRPSPVVTTPITARS